MNTQHTPGPWNLTSSASEPLLVTDGYNVAIAGISYACHPQEAEANARLIASAPELLAALQELVADKYLADPINADRLKSARAAIAKATH